MVTFQNKMEISPCDFFYARNHRVPANSAMTQKDSTEHNSAGSHSTYSIWSRSTKQTITAKYIDGTTMLGQYDRPFNLKDNFPKGKNRHKPIHSAEKKDTRDAYMSILPTDTFCIITEKVHSPRSIAIATIQSSALPEISSKSANIRNNHSLHATIFDDAIQLNFSSNLTASHANGAWIRRYKAINESQSLSNITRDQSYKEKLSLKKRRCKKIFLASSVSTFPASLNKRQLEKC